MIKDPKTRKILKIVITIILVSASIYLFFNGKALYQTVGYSINPTSFEDSELDSLLASYENSPSLITASGVEGQVAEGWLAYPKLGIEAPIIWGVPIGESTPKMNNGLVHIDSSSRPGGGGTVFISGHSSYYWWQEGKYKEIFANLSKAEVGDKIVIRQDGIFIYEVISVTEVNKNTPIDIKSTNDKEELKLMTCTPLGTDIGRLIVEANL